MVEDINKNAPSEWILTYCLNVNESQKVFLFLSHLQKINEITMADTNFVHVFEDETKLKMPLRFSHLYLQHIAKSNSKNYQKNTYDRNIGSTQRSC